MLILLCMKRNFKNVSLVHSKLLAIKGNKHITQLEEKQI